MNGPLIQWLRQLSACIILIIFRHNKGSQRTCQWGLSCTSHHRRTVCGGKISENKTRYVMPKFLDTAHPRRIFLLSTMATGVPYFPPPRSFEICCLKFFCMRSLEKDRCDNCRVDPEWVLKSRILKTLPRHHATSSPPFLLTSPCLLVCQTVQSREERSSRTTTHGWRK